jgi:hypothetical protein
VAAISCAPSLAPDMRTRQHCRSFPPLRSLLKPNRLWQVQGSDTRAGGEMVNSVATCGFRPLMVLAWRQRPCPTPAPLKQRGDAAAPQAKLRASE